MSFLTSWFRREPDDFEQVLTKLKTDIERRQTRMSELGLRGRRATLLVTLWTLAFWAMYSTAWYTNPNLIPFVIGRERGNGVDKAVKGAPVVLGPIVILFARRIVQLWYSRISVAEENKLQELRKEQRKKVEQFKKQNKYYETKTLLEKFDDGTPGTPGRNSGFKAQQQRTPQSTPQRPMIKTPGTPARVVVPPHLAVSPPQPQGPPQKRWFDKAADLILGDEDDGSTTSANRYALICQKCFAHNGLVKESVWEVTQYVCPKCGYFNPSARAIREGSVPPTPASAMTMSYMNTPITPRTPANVALPHPITGAPMLTPQNTSGGRDTGPRLNGSSSLRSLRPIAEDTKIKRRRKSVAARPSSDEEEEEENEKEETGYSMEVDS